MECKLPTAKSQSYFDLVTGIQKPGQISDLDIVITNVRPGTKLDLLDCDLLLLLF